jgi:ABC-type antimicrobial peptide transport system permease subunit
MLKLALEYLVHGFRSSWKLYVTNILALMAILLLFGYLEGARRQLNLRNSVFSGETVVKMKVEEPDIEAELRAGLPGLTSISKKVRAPVAYKALGKEAVGQAELLGADLRPGDGDPLSSWLEIISGRTIRNGREILVPDSFLADSNVAVGDSVSIQGRTSGNELNSAVFRVCGIYRSPELSFFASPRLIVGYESARSFFQARPQDIEYGLFFRGGSPPASVNALVSKALGDAGRRKVESVESGKISVFDVLNISVQFNVFLLIVVFLVIAVMATVIILVNFNIFTITFRKRRKEIGTLMAFGSPTRAIALALFLESLAQVIVCTAVAASACLALSLAASRIRPGGSFQLLLTLLSGTDRLDLMITFAQLRSCFLIMASAVVLAQAPIAIRVLAGNPAAFLGARR